MQPSSSSSTSTNAPHYACTRCNSRHPFEELSSGQQLCKECRGAFPIVKCTYCRTEFQQESKSNLTICKKCDYNVNKFGKPSACEYCNIIAAFIGNKCQRCTNSEIKYGQPLSCEQCKQRCAFDRKDPESRRKVDGKLLCWLCTLSYKRALLKAKQNDTSMRHTSISVNKRSSGSSSSRHKHRNGDPHHSRQRSHGLPGHGHSSTSNPLVSGVPGASSSAVKKQRLEPKSNGSLSLPTATMVKNENSDHPGLMDTNNSEHVVAVTQLKEKMVNLQRQLKGKDMELLEKDKTIAELRSQIRRDEREWRERLTTAQKSHSDKAVNLHQRLTDLQKQNASLSKANKKSSTNNSLTSANNNNNITPTDSPLL